MRNLIVVCALGLFTVQSAAQNIPIWQADYNGPADRDDNGKLIAIDAAGNSYVSGTSHNGTNIDIVTIKYNSAGVQQWASTYAYIATSSDIPQAIALDASGNVYVTGQTTNASGNIDFATVKYDNSGVQQWAMTYNGSGNSTDGAIDIEVDPSGTVVYVTGTSTASNYNITTIAYSSGGAQLWITHYVGPGNGQDNANSMALDASGNLYVTGYTFNGSNNDFVTIRYNSSGVQQWVATYNGTGNNSDIATRIALDNAGYVYVAGQTNGQSTYDYALICYNSSGVQQWVSVYTATAMSYETFNDLVVDGSGNCYLTGASHNGVTNQYCTVKYNNAGTFQWAGLYSVTPSSNDVAKSITLDANGSCYVTGNSQNSGPANYLTVKYTAGGSLEWTALFNGSSNSHDFGNDIATDGMYVYVTGESRSGSYNNSVTLKYFASPVFATTTQTDVTCFGSCNGSAGVVASGGTAPYTYAWSPVGGTAPTATSLCAGSYSCLITDAVGVTLTKTFSITAPPAITLTPTQTNVACYSDCNGSASVTAAGGTGSYVYAWAPGNGTGPTATGLCAGMYTVTVSSPAGCTATQTYNITQPPIITAGGSSTSVSCFGACNGSATVTTVGFPGPYTYNWTSSSSTSASAGGLCNGVTSCVITPTAGCPAYATFLITQPPMLAATYTSTGETCFGSNNGSASITVSGGVPPYTYQWLPSGGNASTASSLGAGSYTCTATDANGCTLTRTLLITSPPPISTNPMHHDISCFGGGDGHLMVAPSGGTPSYTYAWAPIASSSNQLNGSPPGTYTCTIWDANGCTATQSFTLTQPPPLTAGRMQTDVTCPGAATGSATVVVSGGTPAYSYNWIPSGGNAPVATGLTAGSYSCVITDAEGCSLTKTFVITGPPAFAPSSAITHVLCNGDSNGAVDLTVTGGTPPYSFDWNSGVYTTEDISGLIAGTYSVVLTDSAGCIFSGTMAVTEPAPLTDSMAATASQCSSTCTGSITAFVSGGTPPYNYNWYPVGSPVQTITGLCPGTYTSVVTDDNGCYADDTVSVFSPAPVMVSYNDPMDTACSGDGPFALSGGSPAGGAWSGSFVSGNMFDPTSAAPGIYLVTYTWTDSSGCPGYDSDTIHVDLCMDVAAQNDLQVSVYPNPSAGKVTVSAPPNSMITISDAIGNVVITERSALAQTEIDISAFADGVYIIAVCTETSTTTLRLVLNK